ncbi:MAG: hypothetical protein WDW36_003610 [Sanguina aurantia]
MKDAAGRPLPGMVDVDELLSRLGVIQDTCCTDTKELSQTQLQLLAASESNAVLHQQLAASTQALTHLQALGDAHLDSTQELDSAETMARLTHTLSQIQAAADASANDLVRAQDENHRAVTRLDTKVASLEATGRMEVQALHDKYGVRLRLVEDFKNSLLTEKKVAEGRWAAERASLQASLAAAPDHRREESSWRMSMALMREELESAKRERDSALSLVQQQQQQHNDAGSRARGGPASGPRLPTPGYTRRS